MRPRAFYRTLIVFLLAAGPSWYGLSASAGPRTQVTSFEPPESVVIKVAVAR